MRTQQPPVSQRELESSLIPMRKIFFNQCGLRAGWRLLIFVGIFFALQFAADWMISRLVHPQERSFLDPVGTIYAESETLVLVLVATWIMSKVEHCSFAKYGIPLPSALGWEFIVGLCWGLASTSLLVGLIAAFGGYRIVGLALHGTQLWYFLAIWTIANLLIGFSEELQFRGYLLGFWPAAISISVGFGALHYFLKPHERWEDFASTGLLSLFVCLTLRRTGTLALAIGFHAAFDFANLFLWSGRNAGEYATGHLLETAWNGPQWLTGGPLGPEASWMIFVVIAAMSWIFNKRYKYRKFPLNIAARC